MGHVKEGGKSHRFRRRLLAGMAAVAVFGSSLAVPGNVGTAYAKEAATSGPAVSEPQVRSVNLNIDGKIAGLEDPTVPVSTEAEWSNGTGTYIYFGNMGRSRLLDSDTMDFSKDGERSMFLVCDWSTGGGYYNADVTADNGQNKANDWKFSEIYLYLNGKKEAPDSCYSGNFFEKLFHKAQQAALIENYNTSHGDWEETSGELAYSALTGEKVFLLDAREAEHEGYGFSHTHMASQSRRFRNGGGWLRSPSASDDTKAGVTYSLEGCNVISGAVSSDEVTVINNQIYPACNIRLSSVFYTAYREEDQLLSANLDADESYRMTKEKGESNAWTVSVFDGNDGFRARRVDDDGILQPGGGIHFTIDSMGKSGEDVEYDRISAMLVDENGTVVAYGKICDLPVNGSFLTVKIPEGVADGKYTVKIFAEDMLYEPEWHGYFYTPAGSIASNPVDIEVEIDKRDKPSVQFHTYTPSVAYSGDRLSVPGTSEIGIMGAEYEDVEFSWYKDSVSEENRLGEAPKDAGTYYLKASIPETETRQSASAVNGPTVITPKTVTPYITGSISKTYNGSDSIDGAESTLSICLEGMIEDDNVSASGKIRYADSGIGSGKTVIAEDIKISGADKGNYNLSSTTASADIGTIGKKAYPLNIPQNQIDAPNTVKTVFDSLLLPDGWEWQNGDRDKEIPAGVSVVATAEYIGDDKGIYQTTSVAVTIIREACTEDTTVRFDGDVDCEPTCTEQGKGHTICSICGDVMRDSVTVDAKGHDWDADFTIDKAADCREAGSKSIHCKNCDSTKDVTEIEITGHSWNEGKVIQEATCQKKGQKVFSCNNCGDTRTETLAKTDHMPGILVKENPVNADCTESGSYDEVAYCTSCNQEISRKKMEAAALGHNLSKVPEKAATVSEAGYRAHWACSRCGRLFSDEDASAEISILDVTIPKVDGQGTTGTGNTGNDDSPSPSKPGDNPANPTQPPSDENGETPKPSDGGNTPGTSPSGDNETPSPSPSSGDDERPSTAPAENENVTSSPKPPVNDGGIPSPHPSGDDVTPSLNPSDNDSSVTPTPFPSQDNGDVDKDKTAGDESGRGKDKTDTGQKKQDIGDGSNEDNKPQPKAGEQFKDIKTNAVYTVLNVSSRTAAYTKPLDKKQKTIIIPAAVNINGVKYKITAIADKAFKGNKNVTKVKMGSGITRIGKNAFYGCKSLKTVTIGKNATEIGAKAFYKCTSLTKVTIPAKVRKIGKSAFYGCRKLKLVDVKTKKLTGKRVGAKAFQNIHKKARIKVPAAKRKAYKKLFRAKGVTGKKQVIK